MLIKPDLIYILRFLDILFVAGVNVQHVSLNPKLR